MNRTGFMSMSMGKCRYFEASVCTGLFVDEFSWQVSEQGSSGGLMLLVKSTIYWKNGWQMCGRHIQKSI